MEIIPKVNAIKSQIILQGHSLRSFAKKNNLSAPYLSDVLNYHSSPSPKYAKRISEAIGLDFNDLFEIKKEQEVK